MNTYSAMMISPNAAVIPNISGKNRNGNTAELLLSPDLGVTESSAKTATPIDPYRSTSAARPQIRLAANRLMPRVAYRKSAGGRTCSP